LHQTDITPRTITSFYFTWHANATLPGTVRLLESLEVLEHPDISASFNLDWLSLGEQQIGVWSVVMLKLSSLRVSTARQRYRSGAGNDIHGPMKIIRALDMPQLEHTSADIFLHRDSWVETGTSCTTGLSHLLDLRKRAMPSARSFVLENLNITSRSSMMSEDLGPFVRNLPGLNFLSINSCEAVYIWDEGVALTQLREVRVKHDGNFRLEDLMFYDRPSLFLIRLRYLCKLLLKKVQVFLVSSFEEHLKATQSLFPKTLWVADESILVDRVTAKPSK
jgi:hypothetical protein